MARRSEEQLNVFIREHARQVRRFLLARQARPDDIDDLLQEVFAIAWQKQAHIRAGKAKPYLIGIARHVLMNYKRKLTIYSTKLQSALDDITQNTIGRHTDVLGPGQHMLQREDRREIDQLLEKLPANHRKTLQLIYLDELPRTEAALRLGVSRPTLHHYEKSALAQLAQLISIK